MVRALAVNVPGAEPVRRELAAPTTAGGSRADGILLPGAPPRAVRLAPAPAGVVVEAGAAGVRVGGHAVPPGSNRLLRPGERVELAGASISAAGTPAADGTRAAASAVLRGELAAEAGVVVLTGPCAGGRHALGDGLTAGRGREASIRVPDPLASRVHLRIRPAAEGATVEDLGSKNGVRVNGVKLDRGPQPIRPGDEIAFGATLLAIEDPWGPEPEPEPDAAPGPGARKGGRARFPPALAAALLLALSAAALAAAAS